MGADKDSRFQVQKKAGGATNQSSQPRSLINDKGENYELCYVNKLFTWLRIHNTTKSFFCQHIFVNFFMFFHKSAQKPLQNCQKFLCKIAIFASFVKIVKKIFYKFWI